MRAFLAIPLDAAVTNTLGSWQEELKSVGVPVKWVSRDHFHITTHFFEEISTAQAAACRDRLREAMTRFPAFRSEIKGTGQFPAEGYPKVLWVGMGDGSTVCGHLAAACQEVVAAVGCPVDTRPFHAHVTLGRVRGGKNLKAVIDRLDLNRDHLWGMTAVKRIVLLQSTLTREGPVYTLLWEIPLGGKRDS